MYIEIYRNADLLQIFVYWLEMHATSIHKLIAIVIGIFSKSRY